MADLFLLSKCNNRCINCVGCPENNEFHSLEEFIKMEAELKSDNFIAYGGGEPTLHQEFFEITDYLNQLNKKAEILLLTNGRAFSNNSFLNKFDAIKIDKKRFRIATAIYGQNSKTHDAISRTPGSFKETVKGIKNLIKKGYKIEIRVIITKLNYKNLKKIAEFIAKEFKGIERVAFISAKFTWESYKNRNILIVPYKDVIKELIPAIDVLSKKNFIVWLFHFPHCVLPKEYQKYSHGKTIKKKEIHFSKECDKCKYFNDCSGMWNTYYNLVGDSELNIKEDKNV